MTLDDLERYNRGFCWFFWRFQAVRHILRTTCAEISLDRHGKATYKILSIKRRFRRFKSRFFLGSRKPGHGGIKKPYLHKVVILPLLVSLSWNRLQIGMGVLPITTSTSDELFSRITVDDSERPWTSKIRGFYLFLRSSAAAHIPRMNCNEMAEVRLTVCERELL